MFVSRFALLIGLLIATEGIVGLVVPSMFLRIVAFFQTPPVIYFAAAIRVVFGIILVRAAPVSRAPIVLLVIGIIVAISALLTPVVGTWGTRLVFNWWSSSGPASVCLTAGVAAALGIFIIDAVARRL